MASRIQVGQTIYGNAIQFDGSTQYARRTAVSSTAVNNITYMCWAKVLAYSSAAIFQHGDRRSGGGDGLELRVTAGGVFNVDYIFVTNLSSGYTLSLNTWYHLAWVRNGGTSQCYVNGVAQGGTSASAPNTPSTQMVLGSNYISDTLAVSSKFNGVVDDVRVYNRALSASEVLIAYNRGLDANNPDVDSNGLRMWIKCDETTGGTLYDSSVYGNDFTLVGAPSFTQGVVQVSNVSINRSPIDVTRSDASGRTSL